MAKSINQSFSYAVEHMATIAEAEDLAKKHGKSFSKYLLGLIQEDLANQKNGEALSRLPIMAENHSRQSTISEYDIKFFVPTEERIIQIKNLTKEQQTRLAQEVIKVQKEIRAVRK